MVTVADGDELFIWSQSNARLERIPRSTLVANTGAAQKAFLELTDTPNTFASAASQIVAVNSTATALEFVPQSQNKVFACRLNLSAGYPVPIGGWTALTFDQIQYGEVAWWNISNPSRLVLPFTGWYNLGFHVSVSNPTDAQDAIKLRIVRNGSNTAALALAQIQYQNITGDADYAGSLSVCFYCLADDYIEGFVNGVSGEQNLTVGNSTALWGFYLGSGLGVPTVDDFLDLQDTPVSYGTFGTDFVAVDSFETGLEFTPAPVGMTVLAARLNLGSYGLDTGLTAVQWDAIAQGDASFWTVANPSRVLITSTGWYSIYCSVEVYHLSAQPQSDPSGFLQINGDTNIATGRLCYASHRIGADASELNWEIALSTAYYFTAGDYVEFILNITQTNQFTLDAPSSYLSIAKYGGA